MARFDPVDPRVRLAIAQWPPDAPRGAVSTFCLEHAISAEDLLRDPATGARGGAGRGSGAAQPTARASPNPITEDIKKQGPITSEAVIPKVENQPRSPH